MTALTDELNHALRRPDFPELARRLHEAHVQEQQRREQFRQDLGVRFKHGEFINGEVVLPSPMKFRHRRVMSRFAAIGEAFLTRHPVGVLETGGLLVQMTRNDYEPDVYFWPRAVSETFTPDQAVFPPPAFIAEILSPSTEQRDRGVKFQDYAAHGVAEYWIIDPEAQTVECYDLADGEYRLREKVSSASGALLRSMAIQGLIFPVGALFDDEAHQAALEAVRSAG